MKAIKTISISLLTSSLIVLAGCSTTPTTSNTNTTANTNFVVNTNTVNTNVNSNTDIDVNENTNTEVSSDVDTSDWLTYTNDEYGFSFKHPNTYSISASHEGMNLMDSSNADDVASQENIKFYIQNYNDAPDKKGEAYALLLTKTELSELKNRISTDADKIINNLPVNIYYNYDVPGAAFYRGANFFANQDYVTVSTVIAPENIDYPNHSFNNETREWAGTVIESLNKGQLLSQHDQERVRIFNGIIASLEIN